MKNRLLAWLSRTVPGNFGDWTIAMSLVSLALFIAGFSDGGD